MNSIRSKLFGLICCSLLLLMGAWNAEGQDKIINIQDYKVKEHSPNDSIQHKFKDIEIFRYQDTLIYRRVIYVNDTIKGMQVPEKPVQGVFHEICIWGRSKETPKSVTMFELHGYEGNIDSASYRWVNDSTLLIRVYDSKSKEEINLRFTGDVLYQKEYGGPSVESMDYEINLK